MHRSNVGRRIRVLVGATVLALFGPAAVAGTTAAAPENSSRGAAPAARLVCGGTVHASFDPKVTNTVRKIHARLTGTLDKCYSPDGSTSGLKSARFTASGSSSASCQQPPELITGDVRITWYSQPGQQGNVVGRTVLRPAGGSGAVAGEVTGNATADSTVLAGSRATVSGSPSAGYQQCSGGGVANTSGTLTASFHHG